MINAADVLLWGTKIGTVWQPEGEVCAAFEYDHDFLQSGIEVSPIRMPLNKNIYRFSEMARLDAFHGMPGLLADSLPDKFGNAVINEWLSRKGRSPESFTAIERLCYTGKRGMGALEYEPAIGPVGSAEEIDVTEMSDLASEILTGKKNAKLSDRDISLARLMEIGSSAGGARAKAVVTWNEKSGEIRSGQTEPGSDFRHWLIKFDGVDGNGDRGIADKKHYTRIEYAYYCMATDAGIQMQECRLLDRDDRSHFMTLRYDRENGKKIHVQTLAALGHFDFNQPRSCSYEQYAELAARLHPGFQEMKQLFIRAAFNVIGMNCDDHVKNFSFMMDRQGSWKMTPAYDITFAYKPDNKWLGSHQMTINGKSSGIEIEDLLVFGERIGLSAVFCKKTIACITDKVEHWMDYADQCGIIEERAEEIAVMLNQTGFVRISLPK